MSRKLNEIVRVAVLVLEEDGEEARLEQERFDATRRALQEQKSLIASPPRPPSPAYLFSPPPPPSPPPAEITVLRCGARTNPFRLGQGAAATPTVHNLQW